MARYNPHHEVETIYDAVDTWRKKCLEGNGSIFSDEELWTAEAIATLYEKKDKYESFEKLEVEIKGDSKLCKLMAEIFWVFRLFPSPHDVSENIKRTKIKEIWSYSVDNDKLPEDHKMLSDKHLGGIGGVGSFMVFPELQFFIMVIHEFKNGDVNKILKSGTDFIKWLYEISNGKKPQFINILPHLLFPDTFERVSSNRQKRQILFAWQSTLNLPAGKYDSEEDFKEFKLIEIDEMLLELRNKLRKKTRK